MLKIFVTKSRRVVEMSRFEMMLQNIVTLTRFIIFMVVSVMFIKLVISVGLKIGLQLFVIAIVVKYFALLKQRFFNK